MKRKHILLYSTYSLATVGIETAIYSLFTDCIVIKCNSLTLKDISTDTPVDAIVVYHDGLCQSPFAVLHFLSLCYQLQPKAHRVIFCNSLYTNEVYHHSKLIPSTLIDYKESLSNLLRCLHLGILGYKVMSPLVKKIIYNSEPGSIVDKLRTLTPQEKWILSLLMQSEKATDLARKWKMSAKTISHHKRRALRKLGLSHRYGVCQHLFLQHFLNKTAVDYPLRVHITYEQWKSGELFFEATNETLFA